jgi:peptide/nickel transport system ATP-binding protein
VGHTGCVFAARCPHKLGSICDTTAPPFRVLSPSHAIACHLYTMLTSVLQQLHAQPLLQAG